MSKLIIDIAGLTLTQEDKELLSHPKVAGIILFSRNFHSLEQIKQLIAEIKKLKNQQLLITIDQEGGVVQRIKYPLSIIPPASQIQTNTDARKYGYLIASELRSIGIDLNFAPVIDLNNQSSKVLNQRTFHSDPNTVYLLAFNMIKGMNDAGMPAIAKHFPGHGCINEDSHYQLPQSDLSLDNLEKTHLIPFLKLISQNKLYGIMSSHIIFSKIDKLPVTFSNIWLKNILRKKYSFKGKIFSDDLSMQAAKKAFPDIIQRVEYALNNGVDYALICNDRAAVLDLLERYKSNYSQI